MLAVPSMYRSFHSEPEAPKSYVSSAEGIRSDATSAVTVTVSVAALPSVTLPVEDRVVKTPVDGIEDPIAVPSIVPPLMSMVLTAPPFDTVAPAKLMLALAVRLVKVPGAAEAPPIVAPSTVPPLMSAVSATSESMLAVPSI